MSEILDAILKADKKMVDEKKGVIKWKSGRQKNINPDGMIDHDERDD